MWIRKNNADNVFKPLALSRGLISLPSTIYYFLYLNGASKKKSRQEHFTIVIWIYVYVSSDGSLTEPKPNKRCNYFHFDDEITWLMSLNALKTSRMVVGRQLKMLFAKNKEWKMCKEWLCESTFRIRNFSWIRLMVRYTIGTRKRGDIIYIYTANGPHNQMLKIPVQWLAGWLVWRHRSMNAKTIAHVPVLIPISIQLCVLCHLTGDERRFTEATGDAQTGQFANRLF